MTGVDAMKRAVIVWWRESNEQRERHDLHNQPWLYPDYIAKFLQIISRLTHEVINLETGEWEYEGF